MGIREINKLGKDLQLYSFVDYIGKGFPILLPRGAKVDSLLKEYVEELELKNGYQKVRTPSASRSEIYKIEDRFDAESKKMFVIKDYDIDEQTTTTEDNQIALKPYSSPFHCAVYKNTQHSYKELPIKFYETSVVFRNESDLKGIQTTRQYTTSDNSIFTTMENIESEIKKVVLMQKELTDKLELEVKYVVRTWDDSAKEEYIGNIEEWEKVTNAMYKVLDSLEIKYEKNTSAKMYGPSIITVYSEKKLQNLQVDFEITHRFDTTYNSSENREEFPYYIHSNLVGSYERLLGILIEKYEGKFPFWLAPEQVEIIYNEDELVEKVNEIKEKLEQLNVRVKLNNLPIDKTNKIENAKNMLIPFIVNIEKGTDEFINVIYNNETKDEKIEEFIEEVRKCQKF